MKRETAGSDPRRLTQTKVEVMEIIAHEFTDATAGPLWGRYGSLGEFLDKTPIGPCPDWLRHARREPQRAQTTRGAGPESPEHLDRVRRYLQACAERAPAISGQGG